MLSIVGREAVKAAARRAACEGSFRTREKYDSIPQQNQGGRKAMQGPGGSAALLRQSRHQAISVKFRPSARPVLLELRLRHLLDEARSVVRHRHLPGNAQLQQRMVVAALKHVHVTIQPLALRPHSRANVRQEQRRSIRTEHMSPRREPEFADNAVVAQQANILSFHECLDTNCRRT